MWHTESRKKEGERIMVEKLKEVCEEYGFDIVNKQTQKDETPVEVQFYGITKTMPRWKAEEFARKLNKLGFVPIIDEVYITPPEGFWKGARK